jgi:hypothetical protein
MGSFIVGHNCTKYEVNNESFCGIRQEHDRRRILRPFAAIAVVGGFLASFRRIA